MSTVFIRPLRGHQSKCLRRWVTADEPPYECPDGEAGRLVRHGIAEVVEVDPGDVVETAPDEPDFAAVEERAAARMDEEDLDMYGREVES